MTTLEEDIAKAKLILEKDNAGIHPAANPDILYDLIETISQRRINDNKAYKEYIAILSQAGTNSPVPIVLLDEIGGGTWSRFSTGFFGFSPNVAFVDDKVHIDGSTTFVDGSGDMVFVSTYMFFGLGVMETGHFVSTAAASRVDGVLADGLVGKIYVTIRVFE